MKTTDLVNDLVRQLKPTRVVKFSFLDLLKVVIAGLFSVFAAVAVLGLRGDIGQQAISVRFALESFWLLALATLSILAAFSLSIPSLQNQKFYKIPLAAFFLFLTSALYSFFISSDPFLYLGHGFSCVSEIISISILPASILFYFIRRAASLRRDLVGTLVFLSGLSFGLLGVQLTCIDGTSLHILLWHILPSIIAMSFGILLSKMILKKI